MGIRCGYACINKTLGYGFKSYRKDTVIKRDLPKIVETINYNFTLLEKIVRWNIINNFYLFRVSSNLVPFISDIDFMELNKSYGLFEMSNMYYRCENIRSLIHSSESRLSIHLIEYSHLNSNKESVYLSGYLELINQFKILKLLGGDSIIFHGGGMYGCDPYELLNRLGKRIMGLGNLIDISCLHIENDDRTFNSEHVMSFAKEFGIKWCFDYHHHMCNSCKDIENVLSNYNPNKFHISSGRKGIHDRSHAENIKYTDMLNFLSLMYKCKIYDIDIMFESKGKDESVFKIMNPAGNGYWKLK